MATLLLVRHASTPSTGQRLGGWTAGVELSAEGVAEARDTAARLADLDIAAVYASPLERTRRTAQHIARRHRLRVRSRRGLGEIEYGEWTDQPLAALRRRKLWQSVQSTPSRVTFPGGESIRAAQARAVECTEELASSHHGETVVCVSHADVIKAAVAHHLAIPLDAFQRLVVSPSSVTVLHLPEHGHPLLLRFNDTGPLDPSQLPGGRRTATRRGGRSTPQEDAS